MDGLKEKKFVHGNIATWIKNQKEKGGNMRVSKGLHMCVACVITLAMIGSFMPNYHLKAEELKITNDMVPVSDLISITGYQIRARYDEEGKPDISFRTIALAPSVGTTITVEGQEYTVANVGTIYVLDSDCSGKSANKVLTKDYTILDKSSYTDNKEVQYYTGANIYQGINRTYGFVATELGYTKTETTEEGMEQVFYTRTMTGLNTLMANTIHTRSFVVATDGTIIYSEKSWTTSVAGIAHQMYMKSYMPDLEGHNFLYNNILNSDLLREIYEKNNEYPFYLTKPSEYGWSLVVKP